MDWVIKDLYTDELRSNFLVTADRKKVWQAELNILRELDRICRKHGIRYFADYGTLLGAVRHQGFVPWDDDIDVVMLRPEYERFKQVADTEIREPLFFQNTYTDGFVTGFSKIRDSRTSAVEFPDYDGMHQGIFVDIFPLDDVPDGSVRQNNIFQIELEIWRTIMDERNLHHDLANGAATRLSGDLLRRLLALPRQERFAEYEKFCSNHFGTSEMIDVVTYTFGGSGVQLPREYYADVVYLPFEGIQIPVPKLYHEVLSRRYGDYEKPVRGGSMHEGIILSADISYRELMAAYQKDSLLE